MRRISSGMTTFYKRAFPALFFGILIVAFASALSSKEIRAERWFVLLLPLAMSFIFFLVMKHLIWDLADEVHDAGDALLVRKGDEQERIPLSNIMNVSATLLINPPRVTLRLVHTSKFGDEITFSPQTPFSFTRFARRNPIVDELIVRVDAARTKRLAR
jgi:hypothetical protein